MAVKKQCKYVGIIGATLLAGLVIAISIKKEDKFIVESNEEGYVESVREDNYEESNYDKFLQNKVQEKLELVNNTANEVYEPATASIDLGSGIIILDDKNYIRKLNELNRDIDKYIGREISYEGFVHRVLNEQGEEGYVVARYYEQEHNKIFHTTIMGLNAVYEGSWPEADTWVQVDGIVGKSMFNDQELPSIIIENLIIKDEGQRRVFN